MQPPRPPEHAPEPGNQTDSRRRRMKESVILDFPHHPHFHIRHTALTTYYPAWSSPYTSPSGNTPPYPVDLGDWRADLGPTRGAKTPL